MCNDAARTACAKELKHMQDHDVFEVVWLSDVKSLTKMRSKCLEDTTGSVVKAKFVAQQVAYRERDDVFAGTRHVRMLPHCWHWQPAETRKKPGTSDCSAFVHSPVDELIVIIPPAGIVQPGQELFFETCTVRNAPSVEAPSKNLLEGLELRLGGLKAKCFHERCTTPAVRPRACVTVTTFSWKHHSIG